MEIGLHLDFFFTSLEMLNDKMKPVSARTGAGWHQSPGSVGLAPRLLLHVLGWEHLASLAAGRRKHKIS